MANWIPKNPYYRRKHRLVIDVVMSRYMTESDARDGLQLVLDRNMPTSLGNRVWNSDQPVYIEKLTVSRWSKVIAYWGRTVRIKYTR